MNLIDIPYKNRIMSSLVLIELLVLGVFNLWPVSKQEKIYQDIEFTESNVSMEDVRITKQESSPPPPPKPVVPVTVPNDEIIEEQIITMQEIDISESAQPISEHSIGKVGDSDNITANPQSPPTVIRIVEANQPDEAKKAGIQARIWVNFLVNEEGMVEDASISKVEVYDKKAGEFKKVDRINYGLPEATLTAALQWRFQPARNDGEAVKAYVKHIFSFGI